ncbi:MAG: AAA-like domain-containing protein [Cyanobacteria bacterium J06632_3]
MVIGMEFEKALLVANQAMADQLNRHLSDVETAILRGSWKGQTYDQIAVASGYSDSYLRRDVGNKFWKALSQSLGETVSKNNFREALRRQAAIVQPSLRQPSSSATGSNATDAATLAMSAVEDTAHNRYVERSPLETVCHDTLLQPGALVRVKAPSLMGKTLLMDRVLTELEAKGMRTVSLNLELADRKVHFSDLNRFLRWLCVNITRSLSMPNEIDDYWDEEGMGSKVSCSTYIEEYVLANSDAPLVLCLDDVDLLFPYPDIYEDFFGLLRSWYEMARTRTRPLWKQLRLAIVHSTDVYIPLNINQSPFNVGVPIEPTEFTIDQARDFACKHGLSEMAESSDLSTLMKIVGGHPYLLEQAFESLKSHPDISLGELISEAPTETGLYANHLRDCWLAIRDRPALVETLSKVISAKNAISLESIQAHQLHSLGLIKLTGNLAEPRCQLYRQFFQAQLGGLQ